jgi:hypothetical protein
METANLTSVNYHLQTLREAVAEIVLLQQEPPEGQGQAAADAVLEVLVTQVAIRDASLAALGREIGEPTPHLHSHGLGLAGPSLIAQQAASHIA